MLPEYEIDLEKLNPDQFEELCYELLVELGFQHVTWRRGGADSGRDIQATRSSDAGIVEQYSENWFFECKHHGNGVPPEVLHSKIAWADAERPKHYVFLVSSYITNSARVWLEKIKEAKPYQIHVVDGKRIQQLVHQSPRLRAQYFCSDIQRLMADTHRAWTLHNLIPEPGTLRRLAEPENMIEYEPGQLVFLWASLRVRLTELIRDMDDSEGQSFDHLFVPVKHLANTETSVLDKAKDWALIQDVSGHSTYDLTYTKVFAAQVSYLVGHREILALYSFVRDSDGEGLEVLVDCNSSLTYSIRHLPSNASAALQEAKAKLRIDW